MQQDIDKILADASDVVKSSLNKAKESATTDNAAKILTQYSSQIQSILDTFLKNKGAITQEQLSQLDEQVRLTKLKMLEEKSKNTNIKYITYVGAIVLLFGALWFLSKKNNK